MAVYLSQKKYMRDWVGRDRRDRNTVEIFEWQAVHLSYKAVEPHDILKLVRREKDELFFLFILTLASKNLQNPLKK